VDFFKVGSKVNKNGAIEVFPEFVVRRTKDLMVQGGKFYAIWDDTQGLWSKDSYRVNDLTDELLYKEAEGVGPHAVVKSMTVMDTGYRKKFLELCKLVDDNYKQLDQNIVWSNSEIKREDYASRRLPYPLEPGDHSAWDELMDRLYNPEEKAKLEWAIGAVVSGESKKIQKCIVIYGKGGKGKSTVLNIIQEMFDGYVTQFRAADMGNVNKDFSMAAFNTFPLVAIDHDTDLSRINDNSKLNGIIAHEHIQINEKYKAAYTAKSNAMLFMATNSGVSITDQNSGLIRRLIDVEPTGDLFLPAHYEALMSRIRFEHGAIATHCLEVFRTMGANYYRDYVPTKMMFRTNVFYNFVESNYDIFKAQPYTTLDQAWKMYKEYCVESNAIRVMQRHQVREELKAYFEDFNERKMVDGQSIRNVYRGFKMPGMFKAVDEEDGKYELVLEETTSLFDEHYADYPAQYATDDDTPKQKWIHVTSRLSDIDTRKVHYVKVPDNHIVIDFDIKGPRGGKDLDRNLEEASLWPPTYAEVSKSGGGVHLHYLYEGDVTKLSPKFSEGIEVKVYTGGASLRRKLTKCNALPVTTLNSGLPIKEKKMLQATTIKSEQGLRSMIERNLRKESHPGTYPSVSFIKKILDDAIADELVFDVTDMRPRVLAFAMNSTNKAMECIKIVQQMKFASEQTTEDAGQQIDYDEKPLTFFDVEVYPNLFVVCWKDQGAQQVVRMVNPSPQDVEGLFTKKLVGFNNRRYDNHIIYARSMGYSEMDLYNLSQKIISNNRSAMFGNAYNISYADIYDFSSKKQSLKLFGVELGLHHMEMDLPWDKPVPDDMVDKVVEYCANDVLLTEATFEDRKQDYVARQILADLSGLSVNTTTQNHTARIVFEGDKDAQGSFVYTRLADQFPGYTFDYGVSTYRGETVGEGGYVYAEPGMYENVALLDVASMHPTSIEQLNLFGGYTKNYSALKEARLAIKHGDLNAAKKMLGGKLSPYLSDPDAAEALSYALKIVINIVYGLTSAKFDNAFRDSRNIDNIVAKRGALFMIDLKHFIQEKGYKVVHIKTDSVKIPNADEGIIQAVSDFGARYGYTFEHEATYDKFCLVNDAVYVAKKRSEKNPREWQWITVGAQFSHPYVYKTLFSQEPIDWDDVCETRSVVQGAMYLDWEFDRPAPLHTGLPGMTFVGRTGRFVPVVKDGALLWRVKDEKFYAVTGTKGYQWIEASTAKDFNLYQDVDMRYFESLAEDAIEAIEKFGSFKEFTEGV
jgi:hypothetical protein